jgi:lantibiotic leader peptide-processing serine protease
MNRFTPYLVLAAASLAACSDDAAHPIAPTVNPASLSESASIEPTGKHIVLFSKQSLPGNLASRVAALGGTVDAAYAGIGVAVVAGLTADAAARLQAHDDVRSVEADVTVQWLDPQEVEVAEAENASEATLDPAGAVFYPRQWHLRAIGAQHAWAAGHVGSSSVTVAILDTGISPTHPDLVGRVDFARSTSFVPSDDALVASNFPTLPNWVDLHYHGTHVAATVSSNAVAAAGVTSGVTLVAVKVLGAGGRGSTSGVLAGVMYAADIGADVANMSLGGVFSKALNPGFVAVINRAFNYANRKGTVMVTSAGNSNLDMDADEDLYKAYCNAPHALCVSATGPTARVSVNGPWTDVDARASYSNYGAAVSVSAPGGNGASTVTAACSQQSLAVPVCRTGTFVVGLSGTSMASPHVSGLAALVVERVGRRQPSQVRAIVQQSADDLGDLGRDAVHGRGRINVARALGL